MAMWWKQDKEKLPGALDAYATEVRKRQEWHFRRLETYLRLYGGDRYVTSFNANPIRTAGRPVMTVNRGRDGGVRLALNIVRNMVDAATSRMTEQRYKPTYVPQAGDWELQNRAKLRGRLVEACLLKGKFYEERQKTMRANALVGSGFLEVIPRNGRVYYEYLFPGEVLVDDWQQQTARPRVLVQEKLVDRELLMARYPGNKAAIKKSEGPDERHLGRDPLTDQVVVRKAWRLPSFEGAKDGRFTIATSHAALIDRVWTRERTTLAKWDWSEPLGGFFGEGLGEQLLGIQREINSVLRTVAANVYAGGGLKIACEKNSGIEDAQLSNALGGVRIDYTGTAPTFFVHDLFSPQLLSYIQFLIEKAHSQTGFSELSVSSEIPAALSGSGKSMMVYENIESKRFMNVGRNDQRAVLDVADLTLDAAEDLQAEGGFRVMYPHRSFLEPISWKEALVDRESVEVQCWPASLMPSSIAGRMAVLDELLARGVIDEAEYRQKLEIPDLDAEHDLVSASKELCDERIGRILERGEAMPPHPYMNLDEFVKRATMSYQRAELNKCPVDRLLLLGDAIDMAESLLLEKKKGEMALQAMGAPPPANQQGLPSPTIGALQAPAA